MNPLVFLDLDDVLAIHHLHTGTQAIKAISQGTADSFPELWKHVFDASTRKNLRSLHEEFKPNYVISSTWASYLNRKQMADVLERTDMQFVVSNLHEQWRTPRSETSIRLNEIQSWLNQYSKNDSRPYVIIDDLISGASLDGSTLEHRTVFCEAWVGFTFPKLRTARKILATPKD